MILSLVSGLMIGSFMNVVVARLPKGKSIVHPRSACPTCKKQIAWYDNIPVLSYLLLGGKCRSCKTSISLRYPVIELIVGILFMTTQMKFGWSWVLVLRDWPFVAMLIAITFIDLELRIIPDPLSLGGLVLGLATSYFVPGFSLLLSISGALLGFGLFYGLSWIYYRLKGRMGLGGGDVKLLAMLGAFLGPSGVMTTILMSSILGSVVGLAYGFLVQRSRNRRGAIRNRGLLATSIPYGPFLVIGALYYYLLGDLVWLPFTRPM